MPDVEVALKAKKLANRAQYEAALARRKLEEAQLRARELLKLPFYPF